MPKATYKNGPSSIHKYEKFDGLTKCGWYKVVYWLQVHLNSNKQQVSFS